MLILTGPSSAGPSASIHRLLHQHQPSFFIPGYQSEAEASFATRTGAGMGHPT